MKREIEIKPTVQELADEFAVLPSDKQVDFLVAVVRHFRSWGSYRSERQMLDIGSEMRQAGPFVTDFVRALALETFAEPPEEGLHRALVAWGEQIKARVDAKERGDAQG